MKNYIPLILAVLLGVAAVLAVRRLLRERQAEPEPTASVLAVNRDLASGDLFTSDILVEKVVPQSARPRQAVYWSEVARVIGQRTVRPIRSGDYVLLSDVGGIRTFGSLVAPNEWAVTLDVTGGVAGHVQPGDEVAVMATLKVEKSVPSKDADAAPETEEREVTLTLFPMVRILDTGELLQQEGSRKIVVGLPPQQAQILVAAQRRAELTLALRRPGDESALRREDAGLVDDTTFETLFQNIEPVVVPSKPSERGEGAAVAP